MMSLVMCVVYSDTKLVSDAVLDRQTAGLLCDAFIRLMTALFCPVLETSHCAACT